MSGQSVLFNMASLRTFLQIVFISTYLGICRVQGQSVGQGQLTAEQRLIQSLRRQELTTASPLREDVKARLTGLVKFVISPKAIPSENMITFAVMMGGSPRTHAEKLMYIELLKRVASEHPEFTKQFKSANGTLDDFKMDFYLRQRAQQYVAEKKTAENVDNAISASGANQASSASGAAGSGTVATLPSSVVAPSGTGGSFSGSLIDLPSVPTSIAVPAVETAMTDASAPIVNMFPNPDGTTQTGQQNGGNANTLNLNNVQTVGDLLALHDGGFLV